MKPESERAEQDYERARSLSALRGVDRWTNRIPHHPMSIRLMYFLRAIDWAEYGGEMDWKIGGDGDNGETTMYQMDAFFEMLDQLEGER